MRRFASAFAPVLAPALPIAVPAPPVGVATIDCLRFRRPPARLAKLRAALAVSAGLGDGAGVSSRMSVSAATRVRLREPFNGDFCATASCCAEKNRSSGLAISTNPMKWGCPRGPAVGGASAARAAAAAAALRAGLTAGGSAAAAAAASFLDSSR